MTEQQFNKIYDDLYAPLMLFAVKILGNLESAEDVVHDVFKDLWAGNANMDNIKGYLFIVARNRCINYKRVTGTFYKKHNKFTQQAETYTSPEDFELLKIRVLVLHEIYKHADELPAKAKEAFYLKYKHGLSAAQIARALNKSTSTVRTLLQLSVNVLRQKMKNTDHAY